MLVHCGISEVMNSNLSDDQQIHPQSDWQMEVIGTMQ